jgi:BirA family transcriptional regulator, biotin operon repressor / biotin---[acetyl-CoA-carboxylase] ligase
VLGGESVEGLWLRAEQQSGGIGRLGRKWESPKGNLYCSTIVKIRDADPYPSSLSFLASLAVHDSIQACVPEGHLMLKWPNDVLLNEAKVCGILLEQVEKSVVVGVGINVAVAPKVEGRETTSLYDAGAITVLTAADFLDLLSKNFAERLKQWRISGPQSILNDWQERAHPIGAPLSASIDKDNRIQGAFAGLTDNGALRLKKSDGSLVEIHAGDVEPA